MIASERFNLFNIQLYFTPTHIVTCPNSEVYHFRCHTVEFRFVVPDTSPGVWSPVKYFPQEKKNQPVFLCEFDVLLYFSLKAFNLWIEKS